DQEGAEPVDFHVGQILRHLPEQLDALFQGKQRLFARIVQHRHDQMVENVGRALDDVQMPVGHRIEAARIDRDVFHASSDSPVPNSYSVTAVSPYSPRRNRRSGPILSGSARSEVCSATTTAPGLRSSASAKSRMSASRPANRYGGSRNAMSNAAPRRASSRMA